MSMGLAVTLTLGTKISPIVRKQVRRMAMATKAKLAS